jgi:hypothetical protein
MFATGYTSVSLQCSSAVTSMLKRTVVVYSTACHFRMSPLVNLVTPQYG